MQRLQHRLGMGFRDTQESAGGVFGAAVALFPVLECAGADADESCELDLVLLPSTARPFRLSFSPTTQSHNPT